MAFDLFNSTYSMLSKVLDLRSQRHSLISSNIANADTPGYKAGKIQFEDELNKIMPSNKSLQLKRTCEQHLPQTDLDKMKPEVVLESGAVQRVDGNTVDLDKEIVDMSKNQLMYGALAQILRKKFDGLMSVIKELK